MKLNRWLLVLILPIVLNVTVLFAQDDNKPLNINFSELEIVDFIKITAKILDKNILLTDDVKGKVDFISNNPIYKKDLLNLVTYVLQDKGFTIVESGGILRVVRINDAAKSNLKVFNNSSPKKLSDFNMITEVFNIEFANVDYVSSKVRHLISKSAKLVTDKESNSIVLTDFPSNINTVKQVINYMIKDSARKIEIVNLQNINGASIVNDLKSVSKSIFNETILKEKVEIISNKDTNSILFVGKKENVDFMVEYLKNIDRNGSLVEKVVEVVGLKNAESENIIKIVNGIIAQKVYKEKEEKPFASNDTESNSIILMGPKDEISYLKAIIAKLDFEKLQVYVKAKIMEISQIGIRNVGFKYGLNAGKTTSTGIFSMATELGGMSGANLILPDGFDLDFGEPTSVTTTIDGVTTTTTGNSRISEALALGATINLLENNDALEVVSEPSILCLNNKESSIYIGTTKSIQMGTSTDKNGNATPKLERADIGLTLNVKPRISNKNKVILDITTKVEDVSSKQTNSQPDSNKKELQTTAIVYTGESVILGGYTKYKDQKVVDKIPFLGDIPVVGNLFRNKVDGRDKINLVIVVTPYIVPKSKDLTYIRNQLTQLRMLEDKYTKDTILRLEEAKLKYQKDDIQRDEKLEAVKEEQEKVAAEQEKREEKGSDETITSQERHQQKINKMFGL